MESKTATPTTLNVVIETPKGSNIKYKYDEENDYFLFDKVLPLGHIFPFNFGFLPHTLASDGDPLDVLVLLEAPLAVGCMVPSRLVGVIEAIQTQDGETDRNDRLICVAEKSLRYKRIQSMQELEANLIDGIEQFFISYNQAQDRKFEVLGRFGVTPALKTIRAGEAAYKREKQKLA
jgi:inorganic pyrophosphatase